MFLSTYKSSRILGADSFKSGVMKARSYSEYYFQRTWNVQFAFVFFGEVRLWMVICPFIYFFHRYHVDRIDSIEQIEKTLIKRWGGSVENVRKNLTASEQIIARNYAEKEKTYSFFAPKDLYNAPEGCPLPKAAH